jgi:Triosephosphate isomerase
MKHLFLNLKRFDISPEHGGVNRLAPMQTWGKTIVEQTQNALKVWPDAEFVMYMPEAHLLSAAAARTPDSPIILGCQGIHRQDTAVGGNFGAFTTSRTGNAALEMGCGSVLIGHCEERNDKMGILAEAGITGQAARDAVNHLLNQEILCAQKAGLRVLYCIGEKSEEQDNWQEVLLAQLDDGLRGADTGKVVIGYEPVWSIGPGKTPADRDYIEKIARFVKERTGGIDVVYGGGLKKDNAAMLASIPEIDGGLIALTRFQGEIGFYPEEYLEIIRIYLQNTER